MKAMIFAAGKGERMLPLTRHTPKPLLKVNHKMLIEYHLEKLAQVGVDEVVINVSWMAEKIMQALGSGERYKLNIRYSIENEPLETAGAILHAKEMLGADPILLMNADVYSDYDLGALHKSDLGNAWANLVMVSNPDHNLSGDYCLEENGSLQAKQDNKENLTFSGISLLNPQMVYDFSTNKKALPLRDIFAWAISQGKLQGHFYSGFWSDVGTPLRLNELRAHF